MFYLVIGFCTGSSEEVVTHRSSLINGEWLQKIWNRRVVSVEGTVHFKLTIWNKIHEEISLMITAY